MRARAGDKTARAFLAAKQLDVIDELVRRRVGEAKRVRAEGAHAPRTRPVARICWAFRDRSAAIEARSFRLGGERRNVAVEPIDPESAARIADVDLGRRDGLLPHDFRAPGATEGAVAVRRSLVRKTLVAHVSAISMMPRCI